MYQFKKGYYADIRIEHRYESKISYQCCEIKDMIERSEVGAFIRVYDGKLWYYASTTSLDKVQAELDQLYQLAIYHEAIENLPLVQQFEVHQEKQYQYHDTCVKAIALQEKAGALKSYFPYLENNEYIKMWVIQYSDRYSEYEFYSSKGSSIYYDYQTAGVASMFAMSDASEYYQGFFQKGNTTFVQAMTMQEELRKVIDESAYVLKNAKTVVPGDYPVVLSPVAAGVFAHESFGHKSEADFMLGDEAMKEEWCIGKKVASDGLSIVDTGAVLGSGYVPFDDEGTQAKKTYLIKNGYLQGRLHSATTADALQESLTGNARAVDTSFEPIVRMTTTYIEGGDLSLEQLIAKVKKGYYIKDIRHGSGMSTFTIAPSISYEIIDGKIGQPVKIAVISGSVFETLGLIEGLTDQVELLSFVTGGCGKMEQYPLPVGFGAPYVLVSKMKVQ